MSPESLNKKLIKVGVFLAAAHSVCVCVCVKHFKTVACLFTCLSEIFRISRCQTQ